MRRIFKLLISAIIITLAGSFGTLTSQGKSAQEIPAGIDVSIGPGSLAVAFKMPPFTVERQMVDGERFDILGFAGQTGLSSYPGDPQLPFFSFLIAAPPAAQVHLQDIRFDSEADPGFYRIPAGLEPKPLEEDLTPGEFMPPGDVEAAQSQARLPDEVVRIADEGWVRGQRIVRIVIHPLQFSAAENKITVHTGIAFRIVFQGGDSGEYCVNCRYTPALESALSRQLINYEQGLPWRVPAGSAELLEQIQSPATNPFPGERLEVVVKQDGIYHLTYSDLQAAGMEVDGVDPATFRLINQGREVAIFVSGNGASFEAGDYIAFFGERFRGEVMEARYTSSMTKPSYNPGDPDLAPNNWFWKCQKSCELASYFERYTDENVYYLLAGGQPGLRMAGLDGTPGTAPIAEVYRETVRAETSIHWWSHEWQDDDVWFWDRIRSYDPDGTASRAYTTTLTAVATGVHTATVRGELASKINDPLASPDHHSRIEINGYLIDDRYWDGRTRYAFSNQIPQSELVEGSNTLTITLLDDTVLLAPDMYFDYFEIEYEREFRASNDRLQFARHQTGTWRYQVTDLVSPSVEVYRITDPLNPVRVTNPDVTDAGGGYTALFEVTDFSAPRYIVAGTGSGVRTPERISLYTPPGFDTMAEAEIVMITHSDFLSATQTLADYRSSQGYSVAVIDVSDLYHEFNDGIYHPIAIKNFLAWTFESWSQPVSYAVLIGGGNWNMRNFGDGSIGEYHNAPPTYMPPNLAYVDPWQGEVDSANLLATIVGDDTLPDVHIGRIPVSSSAELEVVVGKIMAYEADAFQEWHKNVLFITDNIPDPAGNFIALSEDIIADYLDPNPAFNALRIYEDDGDGIANGDDFGCTKWTDEECQAATDAVVDAIDSGTLIVNYTGHASLDQWSAEEIFLNSDVASLNNPDRLPFVLSMTCLDGHWTYPNLPSLIYTLMVTPGKGAVGSFSATGLGVATGHDFLQRGFYASLMDDWQFQIGPAADAGKLELWKMGFYQDLMQTFMVFGDPALLLQNVTSGFEVDIYLPVTLR